MQARPIRAVLFDRDGTLILDEPRYNRFPDLVRPIPHAWQALARLRHVGLPLGIVSNQSGIGRGYQSAAEVEAVNARVAQMLGPFGSIRFCPHAPEAGCGCRKPMPGLILAAAADLGVAPQDVVLVGDIGSDMAAARAAGARGIMVPGQRTRREEMAAAPELAVDLLAAADSILAGAGSTS